MSLPVYFDCNATTPTLSIAADAALDTMKSFFGNPSSTHTSGLQAKMILESTRQKAATAIGALASEITFTSGATEGIQTAIFSAMQSEAELRRTNNNAHLKRTKVLYGATEHKAVPQALAHWNHILGLNLECISIEVDNLGQLNLEELKKHLPNALLLCTMAVNNETGVIHDLNAIAKCLAPFRNQCLWMIDCVQGLGKVTLDFNTLKPDFAAFSGHKIYAPKGIGFLYVRTGTVIVPLIVGGGQEKGMRSGTENLPGVSAMGAILDALLNPASGLFFSHSTLVEYRDLIKNTLVETFPTIVFNTPFDVSVPTTLNFSVPGFSSREMHDLFDAGGVRVSSGSACSSSKVTRSYVLDAMKVPEWRSLSAIRLSFGPATTLQEIQKGCQAISEAGRVLRHSCLLPRNLGQDSPIPLTDGVIQLTENSASTWLLVDTASRSCLIIDPIDEVSGRIVQFVQCQNLKVAAILDTHSHADHESCRNPLAKILENHMLDFGKTDILGWPSQTIKVELTDGNIADAISLTCHNAIKNDDQSHCVLVRVLTPGHTNDSVCYLAARSLADGKVTPESVSLVFCGDTILAGGLGRTNFENSDVNSLYDSLKKLNSILPPNALLCSAHDYNSTFTSQWKLEKSTNPLLQNLFCDASKCCPEIFAEQKTLLDQRLSQRESAFQGMVCGMTSATSDSFQNCVSLPFNDLKNFFLNHQNNICVIDVREPFEFEIAQNSSPEVLSFFPDLGAVPRNVPLSRLVNLVHEMFSNSSCPKALLFLCRTGVRSEAAARSFRRMGFANCWSLIGGTATGCTIAPFSAKQKETTAFADSRSAP